MGNVCATLKLDGLNYECKKLADFVYLYNDKITSGLTSLVQLKKTQLYQETVNHDIKVNYEIRKLELEKREYLEKIPK